MEIGSLNFGHVIIVISAVYFACASYAILFSAFSPLTGIYVRCMVVVFGKTNLQNGTVIVIPRF
jgi:hypothetical protein